jgi:lipoprotein NlpD
MLEMRGWRLVAACMIAAGVLGACASRGPRTPAPVEERSSGVRASPTTAATAGEPVKAQGGAENAGKPGYYTVRPGDTLIRIALESGQNWRDVARWNGIENPNVIEVGQVLRVSPPVAAVATASSASAPRPTAPASTTASAPAVVASASTAGPAGVASIPSASSTAAAPAEDDVAWGWPTVGPGMVLAGFDEQKNKGLDIGGKAGEPVLAAADGRVVYAGAGLRGYGNLIILKHNNTYLSAYAHNQTLLVKEDQTVRKGQKIAEMGSSDSDRVKLHFEIRRQGKPVDPARYLPMR